MSNADFNMSDDMDLLRSAVHFLTHCIAGNMDELLASAGLSLPLKSSKIPPWVSVANVQPDLAPVETLSRHWIPYTYDGRKEEVRWCLPQGRAVQPFYDEYISHCRQHFVSALVSPRSSLDSLLQYATRFAQFPDPAGFIFHLSRCGSTLVSGCFAEMEHCSVLSESPLLTDILLARHLSRDDKKALLRLCLHLQGRPSVDQSHVIVKWNAWDIFYWDLLREIWPQVPVLLLTRDPVEILASHSKSTGRHMSGDPALGHVHPVLGGNAAKASPLDFRVQVLRELMAEMLRVSAESGVFLLDYAELDEAALVKIGPLFDICLSPHQRMELRQRLTLNSKSPMVMFQSDGAQKRRSFPQSQLQLIQGTLSNLHHALVQNSYGWP
jgi:hypothetical protein